MTPYVHRWRCGRSIKDSHWCAGGPESARRYTVPSGSEFSVVEERGGWKCALHATVFKEVNPQPHPSLTLGAHAQEGYCSCLVCVYLSVCLLSVTTLAATSFVFTLKNRYVGVCYRLFLDFNSWIFEKTFPSKVMA